MSTHPHSSPPREPAVCKLISIGTATPPFRISQSDAAELAVQLGISSRYKKSLPTLYRQTGVLHRSSVLLEREYSRTEQYQSFYSPRTDQAFKGPTTAERMDAYEQYAVPLALEACRQAIERSHTAPEAYTHLVTVSCSGFNAPGLDIQLIKQLGLSLEIARTNVGFMGCHGAINGLRVAKSFCESQPNAKVLLCATELCSLHQQYSDEPQQLVANALFSDGSAAVVLRSPQGENKTETELLKLELGSGSTIDLIGTGSVLLPDSHDMMSWKIGNNGFEMTLSPKVPDLIQQHLSTWLTQWLERFGVTISEIDSWIVHPGGPRIILAVGEALGLTEAQLQPSLDILANYGNMSSPTVLFLLEQLNAKRALGDRQVMLAFGPGLCIEAALFETAT